MVTERKVVEQKELVDIGDEKQLLTNEVHMFFKRKIVKFRTTKFSHKEWLRFEKIQGFTLSNRDIRSFVLTLFELMDKGKSPKRFTVDLVNGTRNLTKAAKKRIFNKLIY